jgi:very-short-patch-repair endonuclease
LKINDVANRQHEVTSPAKRHGFPTRRINVKVNGKEVDALFPEERVIVELDSVEFHDNPISLRTDRQRDRGCAAHGFVTVRLLKEDLADEDADLLRRRSRSGGRERCVKRSRSGGRRSRPRTPG